MDHAALLDELEKLGVATDEHVQHARKKLDTMGQAGRYALVGAAASPVISGIGSLVAGAPVFGGKGNRLRGALASSVTGALSASALPMARHAIDQQAAKAPDSKTAGMVVEYDAQGNKKAHTHNEWLVSLFKRDKSFAVPPALDHVEAMKKRAFASFADALVKSAGQFEFSTNQFSGPMNPVILSQASVLPPFRQPELQRGLQKKAMTPAGQLAHTQRVGAPKASAPPGPSIADIAKPRGARFGSGIAGAFKTGIGGTAGVALR